MKRADEKELFVKIGCMCRLILKCEGGGNGVSKGLRHLEKLCKSSDE